MRYAFPVRESTSLLLESSVRQTDVSYKPDAVHTSCALSRSTIKRALYARSLELSDLRPSLSIHSHALLLPYVFTGRVADRCCFSPSQTVGVPYKANSTQRLYSRWWSDPALLIAALRFWIAAAARWVRGVRSLLRWSRARLAFVLGCSVLSLEGCEAGATRLSPLACSERADCVKVIDGVSPSDDPQRLRLVP